MQKIPTGVAIIGTLHSIGAIFLLIHVIISIPFIIVLFFEDSGLGFLATFDTIWNWILISIHATIAGALFSRKKWSRNLVMIISAIGLIFSVVDILSGNMFAIFSIIINGVVIGYMKKPHVKQWFNDGTF